MKTRVLSGFLMAPLLIVVYLGDWPLLIATLMVSAIGIKEFFQSFQNIQVYPSLKIGWASLIALSLILVINPDRTGYQFWFFLVILSSLLLLFDIDHRKLEDAMATMTGIVYIGFFSFHLVWIDRLEGYSSFIWVVFITAFGTDTMAYFTGYLFGKHKLCPKISPKKTIEGAIGGLVGSMMFSALFFWIMYQDLLLHGILLGFIAGITSQFGDLTASIFKRKMGIKDYGNLIPGHGGILDRFDSVLFTAPTVYYYLVLVILT